MISDQWLFLPRHLNSTPAVSIDKRTVHHELKLRNSGVEFLFRVGLQLKLNIPVLATASVFFHRFYMRQSIDGHVIYDVAGACIFLACKVEESGRKLRDVASVCQAKATGAPVVSAEQDAGVSAWTKTIMAYEELLLETLCFDLTVEHPHNILLSAAETLQATDHLISYTWSVLSDTFRTPLCVLYSARVIACASYILCLHSMSEGYRLSEFLESQHTHTVYEAFLLDGSDVYGLIPDVLALLLDFYAHIQPLVPEKLWRLNPFIKTKLDINAAYTYQIPPSDNEGKSRSSSPQTEQISAEVTVQNNGT